MKKIIASLCAVALAAALPMSAFGVGSKGDADNAPVRDDVYTYQEAYGTVTINEDGTSVYTMSEQTVEKLGIEGMTSMSVTDATIAYLNKVTKDDIENDNYSGLYTEDAVKEFKDKLAALDGTFLGAFEIIGSPDDPENGSVFVQTMPDMAGHTVKLLILHGDWVEEITVPVGADGVLTYTLHEFSIISLIDMGLTADLERAGRTVGAVGVSPKTGF